MPGIGKTTLAVHVGHMVAEQFPDRQLFVDLHAHTPGQRPVDPAHALATLLAADGVDPRYVPGDLDGRSAMWRARLSKKRVLLILDNAASSNQVAPLLPGAAGCLVLVTSRRYLGDLPSTLVSVPLDTLPPSDAVTMFVNLAPRAEDELKKVTEMVRICGYLPLAISLLAILFTRHRSWTMNDLIGATRATLLTVKAENRTVAAAFELSYQYLTTRQQRFFRHLGLHPGPDIDPYAASALAGLPFEETIEFLDELYRDGLLAEPVPRRYRLHNLIHEYARSLAAADDFADEP
jgi:predicted ATPase